MVNRIQPSFPSFVSLEQVAFIKDQSISNNILTAWEFVHDFGKAPWWRCAMALKLAMKCTYNQVQWNFLDLCT